MAFQWLTHWIANGERQFHVVTQTIPCNDSRPSKQMKGYKSCTAFSPSPSLPPSPPSPLPASAGREPRQLNTPQGIEQTLRGFQGNDFNVQEVYNWRNFDDETSGPHSAPQRSGEAIHGIQASIDANRSLAHRLDNEGVNIRNVVNAEQAADGSITFYVR